ncbi:MAG: hypothetical protein ACOH5I_17135 [Oligoflexus sp.]
MSAFTNLTDRFRASISRGFDLIKRRLLGANNERLDFLMDSFYKLSPSHQTGVLVGLCAFLGIVVIMTFVFYMSRVNALENQLNQGFAALQELRTLGQTYTVEERRYRELQMIINRGAAPFRPKPFFESLGNQVGVTITDLRSSETDIPADRPLSQDFKNVVVDFKMPKVSVPRLLRLLGEIEKSDHNLHLHTLQIRARHGDRLFFETNAKVVGFKPGR